MAAQEDRMKEYDIDEKPQYMIEVIDNIGHVQRESMKEQLLPTTRRRRTTTNTNQNNNNNTYILCSFFNIFTR